MDFFRLLKRIPDVYRNIFPGNVANIYRLVADEMELVKETLDKMERFEDIDQATGYTLDRIGRNVLQAREQMSDEEYREMIKTKIRANLSPGDIETIVELARVFVGDHLASVQEMWMVKNHKNSGEPAALLFTINQYDELKRIPYAALKSVVAGGIRIYFQINESEGTIEYSSIENPIVTIHAYQICDTFSAGGEYEL
ncbi:hypothetical protein JNUCC42_13155 [Brevibacterium sp. JNUCC-42]|nr:hypothetical protein JNUCC42_13155 [Brevibacterium sp. JNUCC-42]